jgi:hypothetical protein
MSTAGPATPCRRIAITDELRRRVLTPYKPHCRYVRTAELSHPEDLRPPAPNDPQSWIRLDADCGIDASCYIDDTGHFNAVEFNITYNQMVYLCLAQTMASRLLPGCGGWDLAEFFRRQLPDVLIVDYRVRFHRPLWSRSFQGFVAITEVHARKERLLVRTRCGCSGAPDGESSGEVLLALMNWRPHDRAGR